jgi:hypothetical protein
MTVSAAAGRQGSYVSYTLKSACPKDKQIEDFYLQDVREVSVQPEPTTGAPNIKNTAQEIMLWEEDHFLGTKTYVVEYTIRTQFFEWEMEKDQSGVISDIPNSLKDRYNKDEWRLDKDNDGVLDNEDDVDNDGQWDYLIEPSNSQIRSLANQLKDGETNVFAIVENIYNYLTSDENLNYVTTSVGLPKDCITTLNDLRGDCDDYSILFISICRALDIPAWLELGVLYDKQSQRWGGHAWAKVAIPLTSGGYAAPTIDVVNKQFLIHDPYRFIEWKDTGEDELYPGETELRNNLDYYYHTFSYQAIGNPDITPPDTNNFLTMSLDESSDKVKVAAEDDSGLNGLCMLPGFESSLMVVGFVLSISVIIITKADTRKRHQ